MGSRRGQRNQKGIISLMKVFSSLLTIFLIFTVSGIGAENLSHKEIYDVMQKKLKEEETQLKKITSKVKFEAFREVCLKEREEYKTDYPGLGSEQNRFIIPYLGSKRKVFGDETVAESILLLDQYGGAMDSEIMDDFYSEILYENPQAAVNAMVKAKKELLPGYYRDQSGDWLYGKGCGLPQKYENGTDAEMEKAKKSIKRRLLKIKSPANTVFINYLFDHKCFDE